MSLDGFADSEVKPMEEKKERTDIPTVDKIDISKEEWTKLNDEHSQIWLQDWLLETIRKNNIPPPYTPYEESDIRLDFQRLQEYDTTKLISDEKYYIKHDIKDKWNKPMGVMWKQHNVGNKSSNYFHEKARFKADSSVSYGVYFTWYNNQLLFRTQDALWTLGMDRVNHTTLKQIMQLRGYIPSQFKPVVAKGVYEFFEAERVFDMSMGWGDRITGFAGNRFGTYYYGTDPNTNTFSKYYDQIQL